MEWSDSGTVNCSTSYNRAMKLSDVSAAQQRAAKFVCEKVVNCPLCGGSRWETGRVDSNHEFKMGEPSPTTPKHVFVECSNCGYSLAFRGERILAMRLD